MLGLYVCLGRERSKRMVFPKHVIAIGSDARNDLVLCDGEVAPFHCRLVYSRERWFLSPPDDAAPASAMSPLDDGAEVAAGIYTIELSLDPSRLDPVEKSLLDQVVAGDLVSRLVYADWLEAQGDAPRAELLRLQQALAPGEPADAAARPVREKERETERRRLRELAGQLDREWRQLVGRPPVESCRKAAAERPCRMDWGTLAPTAQPYVRRCAGCNADVYYARSLDEARRHVGLGRRVAIDHAVVRSSGDLQYVPP
jgi:uncharacterized protein (TIGR02996 family)